MENAQVNFPEKNGQISLDNINSGKKVRICGINGGKGIYRRLLSLGIIPGNEVEVVSIHPWGGPVILKLDDTQLAMGRGMARKVQVVEL